MPWKRKPKIINGFHVGDHIYNDDHYEQARAFYNGEIIDCLDISLDILRISGIQTKWRYLAFGYQLTFRGLRIANGWKEKEELEVEEVEELRKVESEKQKRERAFAKAELAELRELANRFGHQHDVDKLERLKFESENPELVKIADVRPVVIRLTPNQLRENRIIEKIRKREEKKNRYFNPLASLGPRGVSTGQSHVPEWKEKQREERLRIRKLYRDQKIALKQKLSKQRKELYNIRTKKKDYEFQKEITEKIKLSNNYWLRTAIMVEEYANEKAKSEITAQFLTIQRWALVVKWFGPEFSSAAVSWFGEGQEATEMRQTMLCFMSIMDLMGDLK